jgi:hypothetical protein
LRRIDVETHLKGYKYFEIERDFFLINMVSSWLKGILNLVYCYLFLFVSLAVIQAIYIEMFFCNESMFLLVLLIVFCKIDKLTLLITKLVNTLIHFQEMPGFKGKRKRGLTLTLYKKTFRYRLPVSPPRKRTKTSTSTPNLKFPSIRTPSLLKKISFNFKIFISFQTGFHIYSAQPFY